MLRRIVFGIVAGTLSASTAFAQTPPAQTPPAQPPAAAAAAPATRTFASDGGMVLNFVKPDKTADFEAVIAKLKSTAKTRSRSAKICESLNVFKSRIRRPAGRALCVPHRPGGQVRLHGLEHPRRIVSPAEVTEL